MQIFNFADKIAEGNRMIYAADIKAATHDLPYRDIPEFHDAFHDALFGGGCFFVGFDIDGFIQLLDTKGFRFIGAKAFPDITRQ